MSQQQLVNVAIIVNLSIRYFFSNSEVANGSHIRSESQHVCTGWKHIERSTTTMVLLALSTFAVFYLTKKQQHENKCSEYYYSLNVH